VIEARFASGSNSESDDIALLLENALGKIAPQHLPGVDPDRVAVVERRRVAHRGFSNEDGSVLPEGILVGLVGRVSAAITQTGVHWISVGDSLLFLLRKGKLKHLNADHSFRPFLEAMIETGELTKEMAEKHPFRNLLRSALSGDAIELLDAPERPLALQNGDLILAATDGLLTLTDAEIVKTLSGLPPHAKADAIADALLRAVEARNKPRQDNTTVSVVKFKRKTLADLPGAAARKSVSATKTISKPQRFKELSAKNAKRR